MSEHEVVVGGELDAPPAPEPSRRTERLAAGLLLLFAVLTFLVRDHWGPMLRLDESVGAEVARWTARHHTLEDVATGVSLFGSLPFRFAVIGLLAVFLARRGHWRGAWFVVGVEITGSLLNLAVKSLVDRPRPEFNGTSLAPYGASFPSGHAMAAAITYALVVSALLFACAIDRGRRRTLVAVAVAIPFLVGIARVLLGVHYASDVIAGWALGLGWVALATAVLRPWARTSAVTAPSATPQAGRR